MSVTLGPDDLPRFRDAVAGRLGLAFDDARLDRLADALRERLEAFAPGSPGDYIERLVREPEWRDEWRVLAEKLTVAETYFFRYSDHFRAFGDVVLPGGVKPAEPGREFRILSAGCASGEEPYSLAILVRERGAEGSGALKVSVSILGIDVNPAVLERARRARYSPWSLRECPAELRERSFRQEGRDFALREDVRAAVRFEERNLLDPDPLFWQPGAFDLVFCRNVIMYLSPEAARGVIRRMARSLRPDGYLFLGHAETLRGLSDDFHLRHTHGTFYYQRRDRDPGPASEPPEGSRRSWPSAAAPAIATSILDAGASWVEAIQKASDRIADLAKQVPASRAEAPASERPRPDGLGQVLELMGNERFAEAMTVLSALPEAFLRDPDAQLLRAVLLTHGGDLRGAKEACRRLLETDELNAGAHYLTALCLEHEGDPRQAAEHDQAAAYLDPGFAMPRLHLGLLARKERRLTQAREELSVALGLLAKEDPSRILLFGGGFNRDALTELCRREIRACGGTP